MSAYVMIVIFLHSYGPRPNVVMQEFSSEKTCWAAVNEVRAAWKAESPRELLKAVCVPK